MGLLNDLRERWLRGRSRSTRTPEAADDEELVDRILTTPDEASQLDVLPDDQKNQYVEKSPPGGPDRS